MPTTVDKEIHTGTLLYQATLGFEGAFHHNEGELSDNEIEALLYIKSTGSRLFLKPDTRFHNF